VLLNFGLDLNLPEPNRGSVQSSGLRLNWTVGPVQGLGVGPNLAEPFRTGSEPRTRSSMTTRHLHSTTILCNPQCYPLCIARHTVEHLQPSTSPSTVLRMCGMLWARGWSVSYWLEVMCSREYACLLHLPPHVPLDCSLPPYPPPPQCCRRLPQCEPHLNTALKCSTQPHNPKLHRHPAHLGHQPVCAPACSGCRAGGRHALGPRAAWCAAAHDVCHT